MAYNSKKIRKEFGAFIKQYRRKRKNTPDPNDRGYNRKVEEKIKRMNPRELYNIISDIGGRDETMDWPFEDLENVAVFTSTHIIKNKKDILYVSHDEDDGGWQFHSGDETKVEDAMLVSLKHIYTIDPSIGLLADLPLGYIAERESKHDEWVIRENK
jgi:hypothetical protein